MKLSIIVISYNTREMTLACLRSVFAETVLHTFEMLVVDNESSDGSAEAIEAEFGDRVRMIHAGENLGFARANNLAANEANGKYLLLLNPDTVVLDGAIDKLFAFAQKHPEAGIWGGRTLFADGSLNPASCWQRQTLWSVFCRAVGLSSVFRGTTLFDPESYGSWQRDTVREVDIVTGCFFLIRHDLWERLGGFDPAFFMYGEEADLCLRARKLGARPMVTPQATIIHHGGASEKVRADKMVRLLTAKRMLIERHWSPWLVPVGRGLLGMSAWSRMLATKFAAILHIGSGASSWPEIWLRRREWLAANQGFAHVQ